MASTTRTAARGATRSATGAATASSSSSRGCARSTAGGTGPPARRVSTEFKITTTTTRPDRRAPRPHLSTPRAAAPHQTPRPAQALAASACWRADYPSGVEAAARLADLPFAVDAFGSPDGLLAATPRQILSALSNRSHARVADVRAKFQARGIVKGVKYARAVVPTGTRLYAFFLAQAREELRRLHPDAPLDVQRALVVGVYTDVLEAARFDDLASAAARAASSNAADFEALRKHDADLLSRARENPGAAAASKFRALKARLDAAGFGVEGWATSMTPEDTPFLRFQLAKAREAARKRLGHDASALRAAFVTIRTIFREAANFEDDERAVSSDAAAFEALAAADADLVDRARGGYAKFPKKLADMVMRHADVASWDALARELVIFDQARFEREVMPRYFKTNKFDSFHRQLNYHGFSIAKSAADASRPEGALVYSNSDKSVRAVADLATLVSSQGRAKPTPAPKPKPKRRSRAERAAQRVAPAPAPPALQSPAPAAPYNPLVRLHRAVLDQVADIRRAREAEAGAGPAVAEGAAGASPKRARAASPVGVTARVQFTHLRETRDVHLTGGGGRRRRGAAEAGAARIRRRRSARVVDLVHRARRRRGGDGLLAANRRGGARRRAETGGRRRRRRARGVWAVARAAGHHPRGPRGVPVANFPGGPSGAWESSLWTWPRSRRLG